MTELTPNLNKDELYRLVAGDKIWIEFTMLDGPQRAPRVVKRTTSQLIALENTLGADILFHRRSGNAVGTYDTARIIARATDEEIAMWGEVQQRKNENLKVGTIEERELQKVLPSIAVLSNNGFTYELMLRRLSPRQVAQIAYLLKPGPDTSVVLRDYPAEGEIS